MVCAVAQELLLSWLFYLVTFVQFAAGGPRFVLLCEGVCWEVGVLPSFERSLCAFLGVFHGVRRVDYVVYTNIYAHWST